LSDEQGVDVADASGSGELLRTAIMAVPHSRAWPARL